MTSYASLTERLNLFMQGNQSVVDALLREVLPKLHEIAVRELMRERYMVPLSKTELIHEVWLSSLSKGRWQIRDQGHFYALASLAMRRVLVYLARKRLAALPLDESGALIGPAVRACSRFSRPSDHARPLLPLLGETGFAGADF